MRTMKNTHDKATASHKRFAMWAVLLAGILGVTTNAEAYLHPTLGRFVQRDPIGYADGMNLYEYVRSLPVGRVDWRGLTTTQPMTATTSQPVRATLPRSVDPELRLAEDDVTIRKLHAKGKEQRLRYMVDKLVEHGCKDKAIDNANKAVKNRKDCCEMKICKEEARIIAEAYNAMWEKYAYRLDSFGMKTSKDKKKPWRGRLGRQDFDDIKAGWFCNHWARFTWDAVWNLKTKDNKNLRCWKFGRSGDGHWTVSDDKKDLDWITDHNWVTATVGSKPVPEGPHTLRLDPWNDKPRRKFIYTAAEHGLFKAGYFSTDKPTGLPYDAFRMTYLWKRSSKPVRDLSGSYSDSMASQLGTWTINDNRGHIYNFDGNKWVRRYRSPRELRKRY